MLYNVHDVGIRCFFLTVLDKYLQLFYHNIRMLYLSENKEKLYTTEKA